MSEEHFSWQSLLGRILRHSSAARFPVFCIVLVHLRNVRVSNENKRGDVSLRGKTTLKSTKCPFATLANAQVQAHGALTVDVRKSLAFLGGSEELEKERAAYVGKRVHEESSPAGRLAFRVKVRKALVEHLKGGGDGGGGK